MTNGWIATPPRHQPILGNASRSWVAGVILSVVAVLAAAGLLLVVRRLEGALPQSMPRSEMLFTALVATALVAFSRVAWRRFVSERRMGRPSGRDRLVGWGSSLALVLLAVGSCYPFEGLSDLLIWFPMVVADQFWRQTFFDGGRPGAAMAEAAPSSRVPQANEAQALELQEQEFESHDSEEILQQLFRVRDAGGQEQIYGTLRADFLCGQRTATLHVGFCPPLSHLPEVEAESFSGPPAQVKVAQALAHGVRLDVRLSAPAESDCRVLIDMGAWPRENPAAENSGQGAK